MSPVKVRYYEQDRNCTQRLVFELTQEFVELPLVNDFIQITRESTDADLEQDLVGDGRNSVNLESTYLVRSRTFHYSNKPYVTIVLTVVQRSISAQ